MNTKWLEAAARYEAARDQKPSFTSRGPTAQEEPVPTLAQFLANGEGEAARKLLAAAGRDIRLGYTTCSSRTTVVILDAGGFKTVTGLEGLSAAFTDEKPKHNPIEPARALELVRTFEKGSTILAGHLDDELILGELTEEELVLALRKELDQVAAEAP
jgi:hypothetical protein